jgi:hypothetical protein
LDVEKCIVGVHFPGKHAPELQFPDFVLIAAEIRSNGFDAGLVVFFDCELQEFFGISNARLQRDQRMDDPFQLDPLFSERLGAFRMVPDGWIFQFPENFGETFLLVFEVKDTP